MPRQSTQAALSLLLTCTLSHSLHTSHSCCSPLGSPGAPCAPAYPEEPQAWAAAGSGLLWLQAHQLSGSWRNVSGGPCGYSSNEAQGYGQTLGPGEMKTKARQRGCLPHDWNVHRSRTLGSQGREQKRLFCRPCPTYESCVSSALLPGKPVLCFLDLEAWHHAPVSLSPSPPSLCCPITARTPGSGAPQKCSLPGPRKPSLDTHQAPLAA